MDFLPREKLLKYGPDKLSDSELLALLLRTGKKGQSVTIFSKIILKDLLKIGVSNLTLKSLMNIQGLGLAKSCEILAALELSKRLLQGKKNTIIMSPKDVMLAMQDIVLSKKEHFVVFYLDSRNQEIIRDIISIGSLNNSFAHPREIFENAIKNNAASIIIAHNHPSQDPTPSNADIEITKRILEAGKILGIEMLDHVIVSKNKWWSWKEG